MNTNSDMETVGDGVDKSLISEEPQNPVNISMKKVTLSADISSSQNIEAHTVELMDVNHLKVSTQTHGTSSLR